jgi:hypothetical protein
MKNEIVHCHAYCKCGRGVVIRTKNPFNVPQLLSKRGWRIIDPDQSSYAIKTNWRCPSCAELYETIQKQMTMKTNHTPYNDPAMCVHFADNNRCSAGWFHGHCSLCGTCIRCPQYAPKTGLTYDIVNDDEIVSSLGVEYFLEHVIASLKSAFEMTPGFIFTHYVDTERGTLSINDVADADCMLEFGIERHDPNKMHLKFLGRFKG